jgi:hypothetical protein
MFWDRILPGKEVGRQFLYKKKDLPGLKVPSVSITMTLPAPPPDSVGSWNTKESPVKKNSMAKAKKRLDPPETHHACHNEGMNLQDQESETCSIMKVKQVKASVEAKLSLPIASFPFETRHRFP